MVSGGDPEPSSFYADTDNILQIAVASRILSFIWKIDHPLGHNMDSMNHHLPQGFVLSLSTQCQLCQGPSPRIFQMHLGEDQSLSSWVLAVR